MFTESNDSMKYNDILYRCIINIQYVLIGCQFKLSQYSIRNKSMIFITIQ